MNMGRFPIAHFVFASAGVKGLKSASVNYNDKNTNVILGEKSRVIYGEEYITESYENLNFQVGF